MHARLNLTYARRTNAQVYWFRRFCRSGRRRCPPGEPFWAVSRLQTVTPRLPRIPLHYILVDFVYILCCYKYDFVEVQVLNAPRMRS